MLQRILPNAVPGLERMDLPSCTPKNDFLVDTCAENKAYSNLLFQSLAYLLQTLFNTNYLLGIVISSGMPNKNLIITEEGYM